MSATLSKFSSSQLASSYRNRRVFVTGHTGFKGSWLCEWLLAMGAVVTGYSLAPESEPSLFRQLGLAARMNHHEGDILDFPHLEKVMRDSEPDFVFHLAAQPLVRLSYEEPVRTFAVNGQGTVHLLEALRKYSKPCAAVMITTDKCYENLEIHAGYRESDRLGGHDPYSASKAVAEMIIDSYRKSFFSKHSVRVASARAGNVIGGGDWALDRIFPDSMRALERGVPIQIRNPCSTRPWQHVLEPLSGYLRLGASLLNAPAGSNLCSAFNFGPAFSSNQTVEKLVEEVLKHWSGRWENHAAPNAPHEAKLLHLATEKAHAMLGWYPVWDFATAVEQTVVWYREVARGSATPAEITRSQIERYGVEASEHQPEGKPSI